MYYLRKMALFLISQLLFMGLAFAQTHGTAAEAKALAEKAVAYVKSAGADKAFEEFSNRDPKWVDKDLYVFAVKTDGIVLAHGGNKALVLKRCESRSCRAAQWNNGRTPRPCPMRWR